MLTESVKMQIAEKTIDLQPFEMKTVYVGDTFYYVYNNGKEFIVI